VVTLTELLTAKDHHGKSIQVCPFRKNVAVTTFVLSFSAATFSGKNSKMPRKRDLVLGWFNRSRNPSPARPVQQASSSNVGATSSTSLPLTTHPQLSQAGSPGVLSPVSEVTSSSTSPIESNVKEVASIAWEGVKTALVLLKESSDWFPPLKSATGGFLALVDATEVSGTNLILSSNHLT